MTEPTAYAPPMDLVGPGEVAERLGVQRDTVNVWRHRGLMPEPEAVLRTGGFGVQGMPVWRWADVEAWARSTGRLR